MTAKVNHIRTVKESQEARLIRIDPALKDEENFLIAKVDKFNDFRVTLGDIKILSKTQVELSTDVAERLKAKSGSKIRFAPLRSGK